MASHDHPPHASCLLSMMMSDGSRLSFSNQSLFSFPDPSLIWVVDQFNQRHSPDLTDSSPLQCLYSVVMSIQWICVFLPRRRFGSGAFPCCRWLFRLSTGACPLIQGYGGFTWVFDPGINRVLADDEDIIKLVETKKNSHAQWITSGDPMSLFGLVEDENYDSDLSVSNRKTERSSKLVRMIGREAIQTTGRLLLGFRLDEFLALMEFTQVCLVVILRCCTTIPMARSPFDVFVKDATGPLVMLSSTGSDFIDRDNIDCMMEFWLYQFGFCWFELSNLHVGLVNFWRQGFVDIAQIGRLENVFATLRWVLIDMRGSGIGDDMVNFFVVMLRRITQAQYFKETLVRKCWCHYVYISELALDTSALMLRFVKRSHSQRLLYTNRNKEESNMKLDNNRFCDRLASKATLRKASSNSLLLFFLFVYGTYICVCNNCISLILYVFVITLLD